MEAHLGHSRLGKKLRRTSWERTKQGNEVRRSFAITLSSAVPEVPSATVRTAEQRPRYLPDAVAYPDVCVVVLNMERA